MLIFILFDYISILLIKTMHAMMMFFAIFKYK